MNRPQKIAGLLGLLIVLVVPDSKAFPTTLFNAGGVNFTVDKLFMVGIIFLILLGWVTRSPGAEDAPPKVGTLGGLLGLLWCYSIAGTVFNGLTSTMGGLAFVLLSSISGVMLGLVVGLPGVRASKVVLWCALPSALAALGQYFNHNSWPFPSTIYTMRGFYDASHVRIYRAFGINGEPQSFGTMMAIMLAVVFSLWMSGRVKRWKLIILALAFGGGLIASYSRGALFSLVALAALYFLSRLSRPKASEILSFLALASVLIATVQILGFGSALWGRVGRTNDASYTVRQAGWERIWLYIESAGIHGFFGFGPGANVSMRSALGVADNDFVAILLDFGMLGLILWAAVVVLSARRLGLGVGSSVLLLLVFNEMTYEVHNYSTVSFALWFVIGAAWRAGTMKSRRDVDEMRSEIVPATVLGGVGG